MTLKQQRDQLIATLPPLTDVIRGSLLCEHHEGCPCHPKGRYGPYWRLSTAVNGRTKMRQIQDSRVPQIRQAVKNYQKWMKISRQIFELNAQLAISGEDQ